METGTGTPASTVKPYVNHIKCSRGDGFRQLCSQLTNETFYDAVVDFSAYHPLDIEVSVCDVEFFLLLCQFQSPCCIFFFQWQIPLYDFQDNFLQYDKKKTFHLNVDGFCLFRIF